MIKPIVLYNCEVWGHEKLTDNTIEKLHLQFCKQILGVHPKASNSAVLGELGRFPLKIEVQIRVIKLWTKILSMPESILMKQSYKEEYDGISDGVSNNKQSWSNTVRVYLEQEGFTETWQRQTTQADFLNDYERKLKEKYANVWYSDLQAQDKLRTYKKIKTNFSKELYLKEFSDFNKVSPIAQFRVSAHTLNIERQRYVYPKIPADKRLCPLCNVPEDELHFLCSCKRYTTERAKLYQSVRVILPQLNDLTDEEKFIEILTSQNVQTVLSLCNFVAKGFHVRQEALLHA